MIDVHDMSIRYSNGKGVFNADFVVKAGEAIGYLGPNGAGKTTTIRALMGFIQPDSGYCKINNLDCFSSSAKIMKRLGYIPGEISFPNGMYCIDFLEYQCELRSIKDKLRMKSLIERFELDTKGKINRFSKGMKQKLGIIAAFLHDPDVLILDEPTSGLDPIMKHNFIELLLEEKRRGKTILMSTHIFEEAERLCDNILIIKNGKIVAQSDIQTLKSSKRKCYIVHTKEEANLIALGYEVSKVGENTYEVNIKAENTDEFIKKLSSLEIIGLDVKSQTLESIFLNYYGVESI